MTVTLKRNGLVSSKISILGKKGKNKTEKMKQAIAQFMMFTEVSYVEQ